MPPLTLFICSLTDSGETELQDCASRKPQGLLCVKVLLPDGVEDGQGDASEGILDLWQVQALSELNWVFRGWWESLPIVVHPQRWPLTRLPRRRVDLEVVANNLDM